MKAEIKLSAKNHEFRNKSLKLVTIYGDVFAPLSKITIIDKNTVLVPEWIFVNAGLNPCQMVNGYKGRR